MATKRWNVFVSYSRKDRDIVAPLTELMRLTGGAVFRDEDCITPGKQWRVVLTDSLTSAKTIVVFWSGNSAASGPVREEFTLAIKAEKDVVPVVLDDTPLHAALTDYQWLDFRPLIHSITAFGATAGAAVGHALPQATVVGSLIGGVLGVAGAVVGAIAAQFKRKVREDLTEDQKLEIAKIVYQRIVSEIVG